VKKVLAGLIIAFSIYPTAGLCGEFSLFGVKMAMPREEVDKAWGKLPSGEYHIEDSVLFNIQTEFDFRDRLSKLSFSVPITDEYPSNLITTAYQRLIQDLWGDDSTISLNVRGSRGVLEVTVTSRELMEEYIEHIKIRLSTIFKP
jgi:hypothetical protein